MKPDKLIGTTLGGRVLSFFIITIGGGLLQLWVLSLILMTNQSPIRIGDLLGDGGLFFFATSLAFTSFVSLSSKMSIVFGTGQFNVTLVIVAPITLLAVVVYSTVLSGSLGQKAAPFADHVTAQIACAFAAVIYAFYVCTAIGFFKEKANA